MWCGMGYVEAPPPPIIIQAKTLANDIHVIIHPIHKCILVVYLERIF